MIDVDVWSTTLDVCDASFTEALTFLSQDEQLRANRFRDLSQRQRWAASRSYLRHVLSQYVDEPPDAIRFDYGTFGKPVLASHPAVHFSLSHAGELAVAAVTTIGPVGVDVEPLRSFPQLAGMMSLSMTASERAVLDQCSEEERATWFLHGWTRKEAVLKAIGEGLSGKLLNIEVSLDPSDPRLVAWDCHATEDWVIRQINPCAGYIGAVAIEVPEPLQVRIVHRPTHGVVQLSRIRRTPRPT